MVIGINFTGINEDVAALEDYRKALRVRKTIRWPDPVPHGKPPMLRLQGLADNERDARAMRRQADNGRRYILVIGARKGFWAVYIY